MKALYHGCHGFAVHADGPCKGNPWNALAPFRHGQGSGANHLVAIRTVTDRWRVVLWQPCLLQEVERLQHVRWQPCLLQEVERLQRNPWIFSGILIFLGFLRKFVFSDARTAAFCIMQTKDLA